MFKVAEREAGDGLEACKGCALLPTKPDEDGEEEESDLFEEISSIVFWENAGFRTDWRLYPFEYKRLFAAWRDAERRIKDTRERRLPDLMEAYLKAIPR
jgi:hypothetical protein